MATISITSSPSAGTRRRSVEKTSTAALDNNFIGPVSPPADITSGAIRSEAAGTSRNAVVQARKATEPRPATTETLRKRTSKNAKPLWMVVIRVVTKKLLLLSVLLGLIQIVRKLVISNGSPEDLKGNVEELAASVKMMQLQVEVLDRKIGSEMGSVRRKFGEQLAGKAAEFDANLKEVEARTVNLEGFMGDLRGRMQEWLSKEEWKHFVEVTKSKSGDGVSLDEVRAFARGIVEREIEKHAADGIGRVDYALGSAGTHVVKHSEFHWPSWMKTPPRSKISAIAGKVLQPSFGEPGQCLPLKGSSGFVLIKLRTPILLDAVTLEHVSQSVAYDRYSAPKDCRVSGWLNGLSEPSVEAEEMVLLTEFTYNLEKKNIQTFNVVESGSSSVVNLIKFEFTSNHGSPNYTCIYRLRVHGREPHSVSLLKS